MKSLEYPEQTTTITIPENVLGGSPHSDDVAMLNIEHQQNPGIPEHTLFYVTQLWQGLIFDMERDSEAPQRYKLVKKNGITLKVNPYELLISAETTNYDGHYINEILLEIARLINADINIGCLRQSINAINTLRSTMGAGIGEVRSIPPNNFCNNSPPVVAVRRTEFNTILHLPAGVTSKIGNENIYHQFNIEYRRRRAAIDRLDFLRVRNIWSVCFRSNYLFIHRAAKKTDGADDAYLK